VKNHQGNVIKKMGAMSFADVVRVSEQLALGTAEQ
jgi:FixJ family two-component response regulator